MQMTLPLFPGGLDRELLALLKQATEQSENISTSDLLQRVKTHLVLTHDQASNNPMVHARLAEAIATTYETLVNRWNTLPKATLPWFKGAMLYFSRIEDGEHDFHSPIGFEDDVEVLNACLVMADLEELCLNPEDFD